MTSGCCSCYSGTQSWTMTVHAPCFIRALRIFHLSILMFNCTVKAQNKQWLHLGSLLNSLHNCFKICTMRSMSIPSWNTLRKSHRTLAMLERESAEGPQEASPPGIAKGLMVTRLSPHPGTRDARLKSMPWWCLLSQKACCGRLASAYPDHYTLSSFLGEWLQPQSLARQDDICWNWWPNVSDTITHTASSH